ncbi:hypothetical protein [Pantoea sp. SGAir0180]
MKRVARPGKVKHMIPDGAVKKLLVHKMTINALFCTALVRSDVFSPDNCPHGQQPFFWPTLSKKKMYISYLKLMKHIRAA